MIDGDPSRDDLKRLLRTLRSGGKDVPELPDKKIKLIWADHTTAVEIPDGNGRDYYLDVDGVGCIGSISPKRGSRTCNERVRPRRRACRGVAPKRG